MCVEIKGATAKLVYPLSAYSSHLSYAAVASMTQGNNAERETGTFSLSCVSSYEAVLHECA